eukprot:677075_1
MGLEPGRYRLGSMDVTVSEREFDTESESDDENYETNGTVPRENVTAKSAANTGTTSPRICGKIRFSDPDAKNDDCFKGTNASSNRTNTPQDEENISPNRTNTSSNGTNTYISGTKRSPHSPTKDDQFTNGKR